MQKIKIVSNTPIKKPKSLENIDISYGISYYSTYDSKVQIIEEQWGYKTLLNVSKLFQAITPSFNNSKKVTEQVLEDAKFLLEHQKENANNLMIQISHNSLSSKMLNALTIMNIFRKINFFEIGDKEKKYMEIDDIANAANSKNAFIYHETKDMFLGTKFFNTKSQLFKSLKEKFNEKEAISFVFLHEFSHACELENNGKYGKKSTESSFDNLLPSLILLSNYQNLFKIRDELKKENAIGIPDHRIIKTLRTLHQEIYADVGALLLMRNKMIINGSYNEQEFLEKIITVEKSRQNEQENSDKQFIPNGLKGFYHHDHFTSPGLEHLVEKIKGNREILSENDMHHLTGECVNVGIAKTVWAMIEADNLLIPQFKTLFSVRVENNELVIDNSKNHYQDAKSTIDKIIPEKWFNQKDIKIKELNEKGLNKVLSQEDILFNACLNPERTESLLNFQIKKQELEKNLQDKNEINRNIKSLRQKLKNVIKSTTETFKM